METSSKLIQRPSAQKSNRTKSEPSLFEASKFKNQKPECTVVLCIMLVRTGVSAADQEAVEPSSKKIKVEDADICKEADISNLQQP